MTTTLHGPVRPSDPAEEVRHASRTRRPGGKTTSFELASHGGYLRTVTGTIAYLDEDADTFMVLVDGELVRVPLRDITSLHEESAKGGADGSLERDPEGLGTG
jgi:hypothetical protein